MSCDAGWTTENWQQTPVLLSATKTKPTTCTDTKEFSKNNIIAIILTSFSLPCFTNYSKWPAWPALLAWEQPLRAETTRSPIDVSAFHLYELFQTFTD